MSAHALSTSSASDTHGNTVDCTAHRQDGIYRPARVDLYVPARGLRLQLSPDSARHLGAHLICQAAIADVELDQADDLPVLHAAQAAIGVQIAQAETQRRRGVR